MLKVLECSAKVFTGLSYMNNFIQSISTIASHPGNSVSQHEVLENILKGCHSCRHWLDSVEEYIHLLKKEGHVQGNDVQ